METKEMVLMPRGDEWTQIKDIAMIAVKSGLLPSGIKTPEAAAVIALKGRELGLPPMVAFSHIHVIQGKPTMSAEIMLAAIYREMPEADIVFKESTDTRCILLARRKSTQDYAEFIWDTERAKKMGLISKDNWVKQPKTMLRWRAITEMKRTIFPEILMGIDYSREELEESSTENISKDVTPKETKVEVKSVKTVKPEIVEEVKNESAQPTEVKQSEKKPEAKKKSPFVTNYKDGKPVKDEEAPAESEQIQQGFGEQSEPQAEKEMTRDQRIAELKIFQQELGMTDDYFFGKCRHLCGIKENKFSDDQIKNLHEYFQLEAVKNAEQ